MAAEVTVLGCGEAFDERYTNTSLLLNAHQKTILLDCGYSAPAPLWNAVADPDARVYPYLLRDRVARQIGPIVRYAGGEKKGQLVGIDVAGRRSSSRSGFRTPDI